MQPTLSQLCKRLLAALSLAVAATLAAASPEFGGRSVPQSGATPDPGLFSELAGLIEDERRQLPDVGAGGTSLEVRAWVAFLLVATPASNSARPPREALGARKTHPARSGLTRAPPLA